MSVRPLGAAGAFGLLVGIIVLVGLDRVGASLSDWGAALLLVCGCLIGMAAATYAFAPRGSSARGVSPRRDGADPAAAAALRALLDVSSQALIAVDSAGDVTMWSPAAARLLGWTPEDVLGRPLPLVVDDGPFGAGAFAQALREDRLGEGGVVRSRRKDGTAIVIRVSAARVHDGVRSGAGTVLAIDEATTPRLAVDRGEGAGGDLETANALRTVALHATDLPSLLAGVVERTLSSLGTAGGAAWVEQTCAVRGLAAGLPTAIGQVAQTDARERTSCAAVADWKAPPADAPAAMRERFLLHGLRASVFVSFISKGGRAGGVLVASPEPRAWTAQDCAHVELAGEILCEAADRLFLLEEAQQRLQWLDRTRAIGKMLTHPAPVADVARIIGEGARDLGGADRAAVYLCQADSTLTCAWSQNLSGTYVDQVLHFAKMLATGHLMDGAKPDLLELSGGGIDAASPVLYPDVKTLAPAVQIPRLTEAEGYRAVGIWPLVHEGHVLGLLGCYHNAPHTWSPSELDMLQGFAQEAALALHNAHRHEAETQRAADLEVLFDLSRRLRAARNLEEIYPILVGHAVDLLHAENGILALLASERAEFNCVFAAGMPSGMRGTSFPSSGSPFGRVAQGGTLYTTMNFGGEPLPVWMNGFRGIGPAVIVPVRSEQEMIGVFCLGRKRRSDVEPFTEAEVRLLAGIAEIGGTAIRRARLFQNLEQSYMQMVVSLVRTMDARDSYTSGHSERISEWAEAVARELGREEAEVQDIRWGALLHDIGKIGVPDAILRKPGKLTDAEWAIMRKHPEIGEEILASTERMRGVAALVRHHQEKWNGAGYPDRLKENEIPLGARILAVCDAYSAITDDRPYKKARTHEDAVAELRRCAGEQFDPEVVEAFCRVLDRHRELGQATGSVSAATIAPRA
jgi:PAS domain S-box-containing protein/putative nucleotidyltransferase with HDIG domain